MRVSVVGTEYRSKSLDSGSVSKGLLVFCVFSMTQHPFLSLDYPTEGFHQNKSIQRQHPPNGSIAAPDANLQFSESEQKEASGSIPESLLLPSRPNCWLRNFTESADRSRAVTASREHARFRRKLYIFNLSWRCNAVNRNHLFLLAHNEAP